MPQARPEPPRELPSEGAKLWRAAVRHLKRQGTWQDTDAPLLEAYVKSVVTARKARALADAEPFVTGSRGQLVPHPGLKLAADAQRDACRYATTLLLTPEARKRNHLTRPNAPSNELHEILG